MHARLDVKHVLVGSGAGGWWRGRVPGTLSKGSRSCKCMYVTRGPGITVPHVAGC